MKFKLGFEFKFLKFLGGFKDLVGVFFIVILWNVICCWSG